MKNTQNHINKFKTNEAFNTFIDEAMVLETNLSRNITHKHCETLYLYADEETGHIITWYREADPAAGILDAHYYNMYSKIPWQIQGTA